MSNKIISPIYMHVVYPPAPPVNSDLYLTYMCAHTRHPNSQHKCFHFPGMPISTIWAQNMFCLESIHANLFYDFQSLSDQ